MTFDKFVSDFMYFLRNSNVNLGRRDAKSRKAFLELAKAKLLAFNEIISKKLAEQEPKQTTGDMSERVLCIKPKDKNKALDIGKGVHAMTGSESMRADEQLGRSPYGKASEKE